jgi:hypothetical protein
MLGPDISGLVVAPYKILRTTTMPAFIRLFQHRLDLGKWESRSDGIWRFHEQQHGGGYIYFRSADTAESIEGAHVNWAVCDEAGQRQFSEETFRAVERRVRLREGRILITTTPYVLGCLKELADASKLPADDPAARRDVEVVTFPSVENPKFPRREFERARATLPPWMFRMFYLGEWDRPAGLVFSMLDDGCFMNFSEMPSAWQTWPGYAGVDFGYNHPHAMVYAARDPVTDTLYVFDEYYATERTNAENARLAPHRSKVSMAWGDPSAPEAIAEFVQHGWRLTAAPRYDVLGSLKLCFERLATGRLKFVRGRLTELSKELDSYVWDADHPDKVLKLHDHGIDALRYLVVGLRSAGLSGLPDQPDAPGIAGTWSISADVDPYSLEAAAQRGPAPFSPLVGGARRGSRLIGLPRRVGTQGIRGGGAS